MKKAIILISMAAALCSCSGLTLPDNWKETNKDSSENQNFLNEVGKVDGAHTWNVASTPIYADTMIFEPVQGWTGTSSVSTKAGGHPVTGKEAQSYRASSQFTIELIGVDGDALYTLGLYYKNNLGVYVEKPIWKDFTKETYKVNHAMYIPVTTALLGGFGYRERSVFGFYLISTQGGVTKKYYSANSMNKDSDKAHNLFQCNFFGVSPYFIHFEDGFGAHDYKEISIEITDALVAPSNPCCFQEVDCDNGPWMVICEDMGSECDNDFNDCVFLVHRADETHIVIEYCAAGATRPNEIYFNGKHLGEIHSLLGVEDYTKMINTTSEVLEYGVTDSSRVRMHHTLSDPIEVDESFTMSASNMGGFAISRDGMQGEMYVTANPGKAPYMMVVPADFYWCEENAPIFEAYPKFSNWAKDQTKDTDWYLYPVEDRCYFDPIDETVEQ